MGSAGRPLPISLSQSTGDTCRYASPPPGAPGGPGLALPGRQNPGGERLGWSAILDMGREGLRDIPPSGGRSWLLFAFCRERALLRIFREGGDKGEMFAGAPLPTETRSLFPSFPIFPSRYFLYLFATSSPTILLLTLRCSRDESWRKPFPLMQLI